VSIDRAARPAKGEDEVELRRLTPAEKARRRLVRNILVGGFCLLILFVVLMLLVWGRG
jgi:hypothetical protein